MIDLIKKDKNLNLSKVWGNGKVEKSKDGLVISFRTRDGRKPSFYVTISGGDIFNIISNGHEVISES